MSQCLAAAPKARRCDCGALVFANSFRNRLSYLESHISGLCQACQDSFFIATVDDGTPKQYALRRGAVVACADPGELAIFPFVFTAPCRPLAWEARYIVRVVPVLSPPVDPYAELHAMRDVLREHQTRVLSVGAFDHPCLSERFGACELLVGLDAVSLVRAATLCRALGTASHAPIAAAFQRRYGAPVASLGRVMASLGLDGCRSEPLVPAQAGALRLCAWMGALLADPSPSVPALFPDVLLSRPDVVAQCPPWRMDAEPAPRWVSERPRWRGYVE